MTTTEWPYKGPHAWLRDRTILLSLHGSHAYGLNVATSDVDLKGVAVPPAHYLHGFDKTFEQAEQSEPDLVIFGVQKFMRLAAECNPNIIEILFTEESEVRICTAAGRELRDHRQEFLSKKAKHTFSGYAMSQLKRIRGHYRWLKNPPKAPPSRTDMGLPERTVIPTDQLQAAQSAVEKALARWNLTEMSGIEPADRNTLQNTMAEMLAEAKIGTDELYMAAARTVGYDENFIRLLDIERQYTGRKKDWESYQNWLKTRNPARAEIESKYGYDTKHGMHLVRLMKCAREILTTGEVHVKRDDREELLAIRHGAWPYEQLIEWAEKEDKELEAAYHASTLPHAPDREKLACLCVRIVESML